MTPIVHLRLHTLLGLLIVLLRQPTVLAAAHFQGGLSSHWAIPIAESHEQPRPGVADCDELYFEQPIDHFSYHPESNLDGLTFQQRYFVCGRHWWGGPGAPIFFYT